MNFEDFRKAWQCQKPGLKATINDPEALLRELRHTQRQFKRTYLFADMFIVGVEAILIPWFLYCAISFHDWSMYLMAFCCFFIGIFILVDRWHQRRKRPIPNDSLTSCIKSSLVQVTHEIWRSKHILWWYVLPLEIGFAAVAASSGWRAFDWHGRGGGSAMALFNAAFALFFGLGCGLIGWVTYWSSQRGVKKTLEPRRRELQELLAGLNENPSTASQTPPPGKSPNTKTLLLILLLPVAAVGICFLVSKVVKAARPSMELTSKAPAAIDQMLANISANNKLPAMAIAVVADGKIVATNAVGVRKYGGTEKVAVDDRFHLGSVTKSMTATVAAMLVEQGKISWTTTIGEMFSNFKDQIDTDYHNVTLEQLLSQRGGVPGKPPKLLWRQAWEAIGSPAEQRLAFIKGILAEKPEAEPGTKFIYSNQGYAIAGVMLEKASGRTWEELMRSMLFEPLGMKSAGFGAPATLDKVDQPWGHTAGMLSVTPVPPGPGADNPLAISPAGAVHCSIEDLARYAAFHMAGERGEGNLLKPETFKKLHQPVGDKYALGWRVLPRGWAKGNALMHNGSNTMFYVVVWIAPERNFAVVVATNTGSDSAFRACDTAASELIRQYLEK